MSDELEFIEMCDMYGTIWRVRDGESVVETDVTWMVGQRVHDWVLTIEHEVGVKELRIDIDDGLLTPAEVRSLARKFLEIADYADEQNSLEGHS